MEHKSIGKGKKIAGLLLASVLVIGSMGTATALAAKSFDSVPKDTVMSVPNSVTPSSTIEITQGTIQYSKDTYSRTDGSQNLIFECWYNPETKESRQDVKEYASGNQLIKYQSTYLANSENDLITIQRDKDGNPVSGTILKITDQPKFSEQKKVMNYDFNTVKSFYTGSDWTVIGTEKTQDGKTLNKMMADSYQSYINDTTQSNMQRIDFIDQDTGLPVKEEVYEDSTGQFRLFSEDTLEYQYVNDDGTIFNTDGITLTPIQASQYTLG
jgi:hypothetical protein